jgi:hypothetical protein
MYCKTASGELITVKDDDYLEHLDFPAWSFHRLLELCNVYYLGHRDYDSLIHYLQYLIKEGYFNKEYLEK